MPLKPHPTDPNKMVYASPHYDLPDTPTARAYLAKVLEDEDDDIQVYKRPWVGLTEDEIEVIEEKALTKQWAIRMALAAVKERNA